MVFMPSSLGPATWTPDMAHLIDKNRSLQADVDQLRARLRVVVAEVERMRAERHMDNADLAQAYDFARDKGESLERQAVVAWLRTVAPNAPTRRGADELAWCANAIERGEHRRGEDK
jgi:type IV secretory pathway TrbF-like protein